MDRRDRREGRKSTGRRRGLPEGFLTLDSDEDADPSRLLAQRRRRKIYDEDQADDNPYEEVSLSCSRSLLYLLPCSHSTL